MRTINKFSKPVLIAAVALSAFTTNAREKQGLVFKNSSTHKVMDACNAAQSAAELSVNNVRTIIYSGSDMWWDLFGSGNARYAVPKVESWASAINSNFAGNVWFGGLDVNNNLKIAGQTYRQFGIDFWTGPLSTIDASTNADVCNSYDKIFKISRKEVADFVAGGDLTDNIKNWPGNGDITLNHDPALAPWIDKNGVVGGDGLYTPEDGDYPYYDVYSKAEKLPDGTCKARVYGDETLWWVYNDNGNVHQATGGSAIGMEVRAQAFAFKTTDDVNNMTFYNYQIINRSSFTLYNTYMTVWTDADLGYYSDDYIGCDVQRGLGYIYNGDPFDETGGGVNGYGAATPALGCDFFQGPVNTTDGIDNDHDGVTDENGEQMGMTKFLYFNNSLPGTPDQITDPDNAQQYYQYMTGFWKDGTPFTCGGNAYGGSIATDYVFTSNTYTAGPCGVTPWDEGGVPGDRRFMQSAGPFTLIPGAINYVTVGLPWAKATTSGDPKSAITALKVADDKAQALFDNCFEVLSGPEAPDLTIQEMNNELIVYLSNKPNSNNYLTNYKEEDKTISIIPGHYPEDKFYRFEGYKVYQLKNSSVSVEDLVDGTKAQLVFQCDVKNGVDRLVNYEFDQTAQGDVAVVKVDKTDNSDKGIQSSFRFTRDKFSNTSEQKVVNNKTYYFMAVAYGYNEFGKYKEDSPWLDASSASSEGQKIVYLQGRKTKQAYGIPHDPSSEKDGTVSNSSYGYGPKVTRHEGQGNGGNYLELTPGQVNDFINTGKSRLDVLQYENGRGPIQIKVVDPLNVPDSKFEVRFISRTYITADSSKKYGKCFDTYTNTINSASHTQGKLSADTITWVLKDLNSGKEYFPCKSIRNVEDFYFSELGLAISISQCGDVANIDGNDDLAKDKIVQAGDFLGASVSGNINWLTGLPDKDGLTAQNWIRSGTSLNPSADNLQTFNDYGNNNDKTQIYTSTSSDPFADPSQIFEGVLGGTWAPYCLTAVTTKTSVTGDQVVYAAPAYPNMVNNANNDRKGQLLPNFDLRNLSSVDVVITPDKSKWTRSIVIEECDEAGLNATGARKLEPRKSKSVDKQGIALGETGCITTEALLDTFNYSMGWFPGYAINVETGERLNIAFGEDSYQTTQNGNDMMWNPTNIVNDTIKNYRYAFGGRHYIYVFGNNKGDSRYSTVPGTPANNMPAAIRGKRMGVGPYSSESSDPNFTALSDFVFMYKYAYQRQYSTATGEAASAQVMLANLWSDAMWVNIPLTTNASYNFKKPENMASDIKVSLRVKKAYRPGMGANIYMPSNVPNVYNQSGYTAASVVLTTNRYCPTNMPIYPVTSGTANTIYRNNENLVAANNNSYGLYTFNTSDIYTQTNVADKLKSSLDLINVVPNPYYGYSTYEGHGQTGRLDNRIRITNLPNKCKIKIFTLNGTLVRTFDRDVAGQEDIQLREISGNNVYMKRVSYQDWDLKNQNGIIVASGLYIIHIDVPEVGEKILKWFGVMRPLDLQSY